MPRRASRRPGALRKSSLFSWGHFWGLSGCSRDAPGVTGTFLECPGASGSAPEQLISTLRIVPGSPLGVSVAPNRFRERFWVDFGHRFSRRFVLRRVAFVDELEQRDTQIDTRCKAKSSSARHMDRHTLRSKRLTDTTARSSGHLCKRLILRASWPANGITLDG